MIIFPPYLKKGDTIGMVCPPGFMAADKVETCVATLHRWGYRVRLGATVGGTSTTYFSVTDDERLADLQEMLDDRSVHAVLCGRGGYGTGRIIDRIKFKKFRKRPKWIIGYSDITVLHSHLYRQYGIASLHSPMAGAFNGEGYRTPEVRSLKYALEGKRPSYSCSSHPFNRPGNCEGELVGGNLSLLAHLTGTASAVKTKGRILFIEDVGEYSYHIDRMAWQLKRSGQFEKLAGLIIGGFTEMKDTERPFGQTVYEILADIVKEYDYPVCFDFPVSHSEKNVALTVGARHSLQVGRNTVKLEGLNNWDTK